MREPGALLTLLPLMLSDSVTAGGDLHRINQLDLFTDEAWCEMKELRSNFPDTYRHRKRHKTTNMPRDAFNVQPCYRHTQTAMAASAVRRVSSLSPSCHPLRHSSSSPIHVLPGSCAPLSSHAPFGSMQKSNYANCQTTLMSKQLYIHLLWLWVWKINTHIFFSFFKT